MLEMMTGSLLKKITESGLEIDPEVFEKLLATDGAVEDYFGYSVTVSADGLTVIVGAYYDNDKGAYSGSVYIFTKQANGSYLETQKLVASDGAFYDLFGSRVAISADGSIVVVGAYYGSDIYSRTGFAFVFTKQADGGYLQTQKLVASDRAAGEYFGSGLAVSADGSTVIVGAYYDNDKDPQSGSAYIFTKQANGSYLQTQKLLASDGVSGDSFGISVAITPDGTTVVIGAYGDDDKGSYSGSAYIFTKQANGSYLETQKLLATDGAANDQFGWSVAVSNTSVVVGAYYHLGKGTAYV